MQNPTARPDAAEYGADFGTYIGKVPDGDIQLFLAAQLTEFQKLLANLPEKEALTKHAPYTWTIKQVVGHIIDTERVFGHRALWIARNGPTPLASFDETNFMNASSFDPIPMPELVEEFVQVRKSHLSMFKHLTPESWLKRGTVCDHPATMRVFPWAIAGHTKHHLDILHKRLGR